jgi:hypothetical protein
MAITTKTKIQNTALTSFVCTLANKKSLCSKTLNIAMNNTIAIGEK